MCCCVSVFCGFWGSQLWSSCLHRKEFTAVFTSLQTFKTPLYCSITNPQNRQQGPSPEGSVKGRGGSKNVLREAEERGLGKRFRACGLECLPSPFSKATWVLWDPDGKSLATGFGILAASGASSCSQRPSLNLSL